MTTSVLNSKAGQYAAIGVIGVVAVLVLYKFFKREAVAAINTAGGIVSGNNDLTKGTAYEGAGIVGTLGAATNAVSGGSLGNFGSWLGGKVYDLTHPDEFNSAAITPAQKIGDNFYNRGLLN